MFSVLQKGLLLVLVIHVLLPPTVLGGLVDGLLGSAVSNLGTNVLDTVVCVEGGAAKTLQDLLNDTTGLGLGTLLVTALTPALTDINSLLTQIIGTLDIIVGSL